jgi:ketosteroid isomerase-like protein
MSATNEATGHGVRALQDRVDICDVLYRYSAAIDSFDYEGVRSTLADDIWAQYGNGEPVRSGDALAKWIKEATATIIWQHHQLTVYHVNVDGDHATALSYLTSHQVFKESPDTAIILVARYHDELRRTGTSWRLSKRTMEVLWGESRAKDAFLESIGGRGPKVWARD